MLLDQLEERCRLAAQTRQRYYRSSSCTRGAPPNQQIQPYHYPPSWRDPWLVGSFGPRLEARFEVGEELGRGHFGVVRACRERGSGATFACKTISKELLQVRLSVSPAISLPCILPCVPCIILTLPAIIHP
ncbi:unnamed protein product [Closterium sp. NIES-54]